MAQGQTRVVLGLALGLMLAGACRDRDDATIPDAEPSAAGRGTDDGAAGAGRLPAAAGSDVAGAGGRTDQSPVVEGGSAGQGSEDSSAPTYPGYTLVLEQNFDQPLDLNTDPIWTWSDGEVVGGQVRFVEEALSFADGKLRITTSEPAQPAAAGESYATGATVPSHPLTSGELRTKFNNYRYGRYEARIKAPITTLSGSEQGNFISSLLVSRTPKVEEWREVTIEVTGGQPDSVLTNLIYGSNASEYGLTKNFAEYVSAKPGFASQGEFHVYAFVWQADSVSWFVDGEHVRSYGQAQITAHKGPAVPEMSGKIMLNTWVFNASWAYGGALGELNTYPFTTEVDYVRFYKQDGEQYPCATTPSCLAPEDLNASKNNPKETDTEG